MPTKFKFKDGSESILKVKHYEYDKSTLKVKEVKRDFSTLFLSTSVGCRIGCKMCFLTYSKDPIKYLSPVEIINNNSNIILTKPTKISFMGMGEGIYHHNYLQTIAQQIAKDKLYGVEVGTMLPFISDQLEDSLNNLKNGRLFYSLHSAIQCSRDQLIKSKVTLSEAKDFLKRLRIKKVCHYTLIKDVNDCDVEIKQAIEFCQRVDAQFRLIEFNKPNKKFDLEPSNRKYEVLKILENSGIDYKICYSSGKSIKAACGMFF